MKIKILIIILLISSCSIQRKIKNIENQQILAKVSLPDEDTNDLRYSQPLEKSSDTMTITDLEGNKLFLMKTIKDEKTGETVVTGSLQAAVVTARFRNIAERNGKIELAFDITIPKSMQDDTWQIRLYPCLILLGDSIHIEDIHITGTEFRKTQLRGYQEYQRFLSSIITDSSYFQYERLIQIFIERNIPELAKLKKDSSYVTPKHIKSIYGVSYDQVKEYYTRKIAKNRNNRKKENLNKKFQKYVKTPMHQQGVRIDSIVKGNNDITYSYTQVLTTRPKLKKIDMVVSGKIIKDGKSLYKMPYTEPLTYYISSISSFAENKTKYIHKIIERKAYANTTANIDFHAGKYNIDSSLNKNQSEIGRIQGNIEILINDTTYNLDSLIVTASCSPEGSYVTNKKLAKLRAKSMKSHIEHYIKTKAVAMTLNIRVDSIEASSIPIKSELNIDIQAKHIPEQWNELEILIAEDRRLNTLEKKKILSYFSVADLEKRQTIMQKDPNYKYIFKTLYPTLRKVKFDFYLHRKGMIKDTIHTTELDTTYSKGVQALSNRDYQKAINYLRPYSDINTAVAYLSLSYDASALSILKNLPRSDKRDYLLALVYSRQGKEKEALEHYIHSVKQNQSIKHRANLDPEISSLIRKYQIKINTH